MSKNIFQFKRFSVKQELCAMKVGTDGTLLGAWANVPQVDSRILDIGTGTGLVALMMAQRFPQAKVVGIDIDDNAVLQAKENVMNSPFGDRIMINREDVTKMIDKEGYGAIVCNPPYFVDALTCPQEQRTIARHAVTLNYQTLMEAARRLLKENGLLSIVIPSDYLNNIENAAAFEHLFIRRICQIKTTPNKLPKRLLIEIAKQPLDTVNFTEEVLEILPGQRSGWYHELTKDFYIK